MSRHAIRSLAVALAVGSALLAATGPGVLAAPPSFAANQHGSAVSTVAQTSLTDLNENGLPNEIPPNPIVPVVNRGRYVSAVATPSEPIVPAP